MKNIKKYKKYKKILQNIFFLIIEKYFKNIQIFQNIS